MYFVTFGAFWNSGTMHAILMDLYSQVTSLANNKDFSAEIGLWEVTSSNAYPAKHTKKLFSFPKLLSEVMTLPYLHFRMCKVWPHI